jgi:hypothetical protein
VGHVEALQITNAWQGMSNGEANWRSAGRPYFLKQPHLLPPSWHQMPCKRGQQCSLLLLYAQPRCIRELL